MADSKARGMKAGMKKAKFGRKGKAVTVGPGRRFEDGSRRARAGVSAQPAARKARTAAVKAKATAKMTAPKAKAKPAAVKLTNKATGLAPATRSKAGNVPLRARNPGGGEFGSKPKRTAKPQSSAAMKARAAGRSQPYAGNRAKALAKPKAPALQNQRATAPKGQIDLLKGIQDAIGQLGANFGRRQISGAMDNAVTRAGGVNRYIKNK